MVRNKRLSLVGYYCIVSSIVFWSLWPRQRDVLCKQRYAERERERGKKERKGEREGKREELKHGTRT